MFKKTQPAIIDVHYIEYIYSAWNPGIHNTCTCTCIAIKIIFNQALYKPSDYTLWLELSWN